MALTEQQREQLLAESKVGYQLEPVYNGVIQRKKEQPEINFDFMRADAGYMEKYKKTTAILNGLKGSIRFIASAGSFLDKLNAAEAAKAPGFGVNVPQAARALYTAANFLSDPEGRNNTTLEEIAKSPVLARKTVAGDTSLEQVGLDVLENAPQVVAQVGISLAAGPAAGAAFMGTQIAGSQYEKLTEKGVRIEDLTLPMAGNVVLQSVMEKYGIGKVLAKIPGGKGLTEKFVEVGKRGLEEGFTEALQEFPEGISNIIAENPEASIGELAGKIVDAFPEMSKDAAYSGLIGAIFGTGISTVKTGFDGIVHDRELNSINERAQKIKDSGADPAYAASVINANLQNEAIQVDAETLYQYAQTQNIDDLAKSLGVTPDVITEAVEKGQDIDILRGNFEATVAQKPDFMEAVKDGVSFEDGGYNVNNARLQREIAKEYQKVAANDEELEAWKKSMTDQLLKAGANKSETLNAIALLETAARTLNPENPMQYMRDNPLEIKRVVSTPKGRYLQTKSANEKLLEDENNFASIVDEYTEGKINDTKTYNVMTTPLALGLAGGKILPVTIDGSKIKHIFDGHSDGMTPELLKQVPRAMADPMMVLDSYAGRKVVVLDLKDAQGSTIIVPLELDVERNRYQVNVVSSAYGKGGENGTDYDWFIEHNLKKGRVSYINKEKTAKWLQSPGSDSASRGNDLDSLLNNSIPDENALRKRREEIQGYYQSAFHGSPHKFDKFDLGAIGTGEGAQAHGWGLYFAKDKKTAENYKETLSKRYTRYNFDYDGKFNKELSAVLNRYIGGTELLALAAGNEIDLRPSIDRAVKSLRDENSWRNKLISILQDQIKKIEDNPKLSITDFLQEIPESEKYRLKSIVTSAKANAKNAGRRANISDVLQGLKRHVEPFIKEMERDLYDADLLESIDPSKLKATPKGTVFEVDIPENDVLLDENKFLYQQPEQVRNALEKLGDGLGHGVTKIDLLYTDLYNGERSVDGNSGRTIYQNLISYFVKYEGNSMDDSVKKASLLLNKYGIKGITYEGIRDGRCFVVFDDQAIKVINKYNQKVNKDTKGSITWDAEGKAIISLFEGSDPSTVIHEAMGHYLSENIMRYSKLPTATEQLRKDRQTLLEYAETNEQEWNELDKPFEELTGEQVRRKTAIHERWATGAEQYFMLGVAPSKDLRRIFANWKKWLLGIYKSISDFVTAHEYASPITPEVQEVFDRALASEEAIIERQKIDGYFAKLPTTITDNLSDASKAKLVTAIENAYGKAVDTLTRESLANFTQERREAINAYREDLTPIITEHVQEQELYRAEKQMTETLGVADAASAARRFRELIGRAANPEEVLTDKEQEFILLFSAVAEENNYSSGENLAKSILSNPTEAQAIKSAVEEEVHKKYPDLYDERQAAELATKEAFYNDESGLVLGIEQQIIEDAAAGILAKQRSTEAKMKLARARRQQARNAAIEIIDSMPINEATRVQKFITAERKAAAKAAVAARDGDMETALTQKRLQALNHELVMESMRTRLAVEKAGRFLKRTKNAKKETWFNDAHQSQAGALFARMGVKLKGYDPANKTMTLGQYVNTMNELLGNADIAEWLLDETVDISNPSALTRDQYFDVVDAIKNIRALAKQEKGVDLMETKKNFNEFKEAALLKLQELETTENIMPGDKAKLNLVDKGIAQGLTADSLYEILDKGKQGFFYNNLYLPLKHKLDLESVDIAHLTKKFETAAKRWKESVGDVYAKVRYPELGTDAGGEPIMLDRTNLVKMLVYSGTRESFRRLCDTPPLGLENSPLWVRETETISAEDARQATAENIMQFLGNNLTIHDVVMAQELINIAEYKWTEKTENERQTKGFSPKKQEATPRELSLSDGNTVVFRGGYFPLVRDTRAGSVPTGNMPFTETNDHQLKYGLHTNTGSMKARTTGARYPVNLTLDAGIREVNASIHDLHFRKVIQGANRIFNDKDITGIMRAKLGTAKVKALREQIEATARPEGMYNASAAEAFMGDITDKMRGKVITYMIGMSLKINTQNLANVALYGNTVEGYGHIAALQDFITNGIILGTKSPRAVREMWQSVQELSPMMAERFRGTDFTTRELMESGKFDGVTKKVMEWSNMSMAFTDGLTAMPVWYGAYTRQLNSGKTQQEAIDYADAIIRKTLGSTRAADVSSMVRTKGSLKIMFMFQTFFNTQFNQWYSEFKRQELNLSNKEYSKAAKEVTSFVCAKWITFTLFSLLLAGENPFGDDDDDEYNDFLSELFSYPLTLGGPIGQVMNYSARRMLDMNTFPYRISPIESSLNMVFTATTDIGKVLRGEKGKEELVEPAVNLTFLSKGLPSQLSKWFFNAWDILYGDMELEVSDLFRRRPKRERDE